MPRGSTHMSPASWSAGSTISSRYRSDQSRGLILVSPPAPNAPGPTTSATGRRGGGQKWGRRSRRCPPAPPRRPPLAAARAPLPRGPVGPGPEAEISAMLGSDPHGQALPTRPRSHAPGFGRRDSRWWSRMAGEGTDHHNLTPDYLHPPSPEKTPPGPTATTRGGTARPGRSGAGEGRSRRSSSSEAGDPDGQDLSPAPAATPPVPERRGREVQSWGSGGGSSPGSPSRPKRPRADGSRSGRNERPRQLRSRRCGLGDTRRRAIPTAKPSHPPPQPRPRSPVEESRGRETELWGNEGTDHHNLAPDYVRSPSPEKNAPGPTAVVRARSRIWVRPGV